MKKKFINETSIEGVLYEHNLEKKVTGETSKNPGTTYISGSISIATDENMTNVVNVYYTYVTALTSKKTPNRIYNELDNIINGKYKAFVDLEEGHKPVRLRVSSKLALREWYDPNNDGFVSIKRNDGGFINVITNDNDYSPNATFKTDMIVTSAVRIPEDEEKGTPEKVVVKGVIFDDYRKAILPYDFTALHSGAMDYFEGLDASPKHPVFTCLWGKQVSSTVVTTKTEESAFGEDRIENYTSTRKDFVITGGKKEPYEWDDESTILATELKDMMQDRETYLATEKQRSIDYQNSSKASTAKSDDVYNF